MGRAKLPQLAADRKSFFVEIFSHRLLFRFAYVYIPFYGESSEFYDKK